MSSLVKQKAKEQSQNNVNMVLDDLTLLKEKCITLYTKGFLL